MLAAHWHTLCFEPSPAPLPQRGAVILTALHGGALVIVSRLAHWPLWAAPLIALMALAPQLFTRRLAPETLLPLGLLYLTALARLGFNYVWPQPIPDWLTYENALFLSAAWAIVLWAALWRRWVWLWLGLGWLAASLQMHRLWLVLPAGVTGSDPFAYAQMAVDFATRGSPLHQFPLATLTHEIGLDPMPTAHIGYTTPDAQGWASTVWPPGFSALLAVFYRLGGEGALLSANLWIGALTLLLTVAFGRMLTHDAEPRWPGLAVGLSAAALLATSTDQLNRLIVPMADGASQLFSTLAVLGVWLAYRRKAWPLAFGAGLALAAAYSVRYTQVLLGCGLALALLQRPKLLGAWALGAALGAAPDVAFRAYVYGSPLAFSSRELGLFSFTALGEALSRLQTDWLTPLEWGWLWPLMLLGLWVVGRRTKWTLIVGLSIYVPVIVFHLPYPFLRGRDLAALAGPLAVLAALGGAALAHWLWRKGLFFRWIVVLACVGGLWPRAQSLLAIQPGFYTFGYLFPGQVTDLQSLAQITEPNAVIACSLNSGAVERYGQRATVRPGQLLQPHQHWANTEWLTFARALRAQQRPLYVLMDSVEMDTPYADLAAHYTLIPAAEISVPYYVHGGGSINQTVTLYRAIWP